MTATDLRPVHNDPDLPGGPHVTVAERYLLAAAMTSAAAHTTAARIVNAAAFYRPAHAAIWTAIHQLRTTGEPCDPVLLVDQLRAAGEHQALRVAPIHHLFDLPWIPASVTWYARIVAGAATRRHAHAAAVRLAQATTADDPAVFRTELDQAMQRLAALARAWDGAEER